MLKEWIFDIFRVHHKGKDKTITRAKLLYLLNTTATTAGISLLTFTDREMRQGYEGLAVCSSPKGLYLLKTEDERREQIALRMKLIYAHFRKIKVLRNYKIESDSEQKELF